MKIAVGALLPVAFLLAVGCSDGSEAIDLSQGLDLPPKQAHQGTLPAYPTAAEQAGKEDSLAVRASYQEIYGITPGPAGSVRVLAEWERADGVLISWPSESEMQSFFYHMAWAVPDDTLLYVITPSAQSSSYLHSQLVQAGLPASQLRFFEFTTDSFWSRDYGPLTVELDGGQPGYVDTRYYPGRDYDDAVPTLLGYYFDRPVYRPQLSSEGGNFMTNGEGLCVMTDWMLEENPQFATAQDLADTLGEYLGCELTVVLDRLVGEGTGHVDMFAKLTQPDTVLVGAYDSYDQPTNARILDANAALLESVSLPTGGNLRVVRIPMPEPRGEAWASFTNSLLINRTAIVPAYSWTTDLQDAAVAAYREALPSDYRVVFVDSSEVIYWGGAVHCTTMAFNTGTITP